MKCSLTKYLDNYQKGREGRREKGKRRKGRRKAGGREERKEKKSKSRIQKEKRQVSFNLSASPRSRVAADAGKSLGFFQCQQITHLCLGCQPVSRKFSEKIFPYYSIFYRRSPGWTGKFNITIPFAPPIYLNIN